jgi:hypothetical protein
MVVPRGTSLRLHPGAGGWVLPAVLPAVLRSRLAGCQPSHPHCACGCVAAVGLSSRW